MNEDEYVLDSQIVSAYLNGHPAIVKRLQEMPQERLFATVVSAYENLRGWFAQVSRQQPRARLLWAFDGLYRTLQFYGWANLLPFDLSAVVRFEDLRQEHRRMGREDLRIAAIVLGRGAVLVTQDEDDFTAITGLRVENWLK